MAFARVSCITDDSDFTPRYEALFGASDSWQAKHDLAELLTALPSQMHALLDFEYMSLLLKLEPDAGPCYYVLGEDDQPALVLSDETPLEEPYLGWSLDRQQPALANGLQQGVAFPSVSRPLNHRVLQSGCAAPLTFQENRLGSLFLGRERSRPFSADEVRFLSLVANRVATALQEILRPRDASGQNSDEDTVPLAEEIEFSSMFKEIVGSSGILARALGNVMRVAPTDATVLITGESGTGKELIARAIHKRSRRSEKPFIRVNCAAIPPSLIASELFGYEKGAFTGAVQRHLGRFEMANGGTIFLDEIGDIPAETQIALLRVLQEHEFERVGGTHPIPIDVRVLAATNLDLRAAVATGKFRRDLYYRLNVFPVEVPSLRERIEDIPALANHFIARHAKKVGKRIRCIDRQAIDRLQEHDWPGNIRELQNIVERAVILCDGDTLSIDRAWLQSETGSKATAPLTLQASASNQERELIEATLRECKGRVAGPSGAARKLGIPRTTLQSKIKSLRINRYRFLCDPV